MDITTRAYRAHFDPAQSEGRIVSGIACPFGSPTEIYERGRLFTESFRQGAYSDTIAKRGDRVKLLGFHEDRSWPLGKPTLLDDRTAGLWIEARVSDTTDGNDALTLVRDGVLDGFSVGFSVPEGGDIWSRDGSTREVVKAELHEVSLVNFPAYDRARVDSVRSATRGDSRFQGTFCEITCAVEEAIEAMLGIVDDDSMMYDPGMSDVWVCDISNTWAVFKVWGPMSMQYEGYWKVAYSVDDTGVATIDGTPQQVEPSYVPVAETPARFQKFAEPITVRFDLELLRLQLVHKRVA